MHFLIIAVPLREASEASGEPCQAKIIHDDRARAARLGRDRHARTFAARRDAMTAQLRAEIAARPR